MTVDLSNHITIKQAMQILGYAERSYLVRQCGLGRIPGAVQDGKLWYIPRQWVLAERDKTPTGQGARGLKRG